MKPLLVFVFLTFCVQSFAQTLTTQDRLNYQNKMRYYKQFNDGINAATYEYMVKAFSYFKGDSYKFSDVIAGFENFTDPLISNSFFLSIIISRNGNVESSKMITYAFCKDMNLSTKIVSYIMNKYKKEIKAYLEREKLEQAIQKKQNDQRVLKQKAEDDLKLRNKTYKEDELSTIPEIRNSNLLEKVLDSAFLTLKKENHILNTVNTFSFEADILLFLGVNGYRDINGFIPTHKLGNYTNISGEIDTNFIHKIDFTSGLSMGQPVKCEFEFRPKRMYHVYYREFKVEKDGQLKVYVNNSASWSNYKKIDLSERYYKPIIESLTKKGTYKVTYITSINPDVGDASENIISVEKIENN